MSRKHSVADTTVRQPNRSTGTQKVQPALGRVSPKALQVMPESFSHSPVTNRLTGAIDSNNLFPWKWVLKSDQGNPEQFEIWELRNNYFFSPRKLVVLTVEDLNNHEYLIPSYPGDIVQPKEAGT